MIAIQKCDWNKISNQDNIHALMSLYGEFHDSCIKEMRFVGKGFVSSNRVMGMAESARLRVLFQRQWDNPSVIEMEFIGLEKMSLGISDNHFPAIFEATLLILHDKLYWANNSEWLPDKPHEYPYTVWICAKSARWRQLENALGPAPFYTSPFGTEDVDAELLIAGKSEGRPLG